MSGKIKKKSHHDDCILSLSDFFDSSDSNTSECSFYSSPQEIFSFNETDVGDRIHIKKGKKSVINELVTGDNSLKTNIEDQRITSTQSKVEEKRNIDIINLNSKKRNIHGNETNKCQEITLRGSRERVVSEITTATSKSQIAMNNDFVIRARLPISGTKKKKIFSLKASQLLALVKKKNHPLHKWADSLTLEIFKYFSLNETKVMVKILSDCICVKAVSR